VTNGRTEVRLGDGQHILVDGGLTEGRTVDVTVRPEKIRVATQTPEPGMSRLRGTVTETVYLGSATHYTVTLADDADIVVFQQNPSDASNIAERGSTVWLSWRPQHSYALPESTAHVAGN
jgi:spermidine/putrescine transport system ATP-binding protein